MRVHSSQSEPCLVRRRRHHAALAVRARGGDPARVWAIPSSPTKRSSRSTLQHNQARRHRRHRHPHGQRAARLRGRQTRARARAPRSSSAASTPRSIPDEAARARRRARGGQGRRRRRRGRRCSRDCAARRAAAASTKAGASSADEFLPARWDLMPPKQLHVGVGADRARLSEALLVLLGVADRRPEAAASAPPTR